MTNESKLDVVNEAMEKVKAERLDRILCSMTGMQIGTYESEVIRVTLESYVFDDPTLDSDDLLDEWQNTVFLTGFRPSVLFTRCMSHSGMESRFAGLTHTDEGKLALFSYLLKRTIFSHTPKDSLTAHIESNQFLHSLNLFLEDFKVLQSDKFQPVLESMLFIDGIASVGAYSKFLGKRVSKHFDSLRDLDETTFNDALQGIVDVLYNEVFNYTETKITDTVKNRYSAAALRAMVEANKDAKPLTQTLPMTHAEKAEAARVKIEQEYRSRYSGGTVVVRKVTREQMLNRMKDEKPKTRKPRKSASRISKTAQINLQNIGNDLLDDILGGLKI